jgi:hypothetical protein
MNFRFDAATIFHIGDTVDNDHAYASLRASLHGDSGAFLVARARPSSGSAANFGSLAFQ